MATEKISTLLSDVSVEGDIVEKDLIIIDAKINGDIKDIIIQWQQENILYNTASFEI